MQSFAWLTVLLHRLPEAMWPNGVSLWLQMIQLTPVPLDFSSSEELQSLLGPLWDVAGQQDAIEFTHSLLTAIAPPILHQTWETLPIRRGVALDTHLQDEKGPPFDPIQLHLTGLSEDQRQCTIQMLVDHWHDERGLCRALCNPGHGLVLSLPHSELVQQHRQIRLKHCEQPFHMPYFTEEGGIAAQEYVPCAMTLHEGHNKDTSDAP